MAPGLLYPAAKEVPVPATALRWLPLLIAAAGLLGAWGLAQGPPEREMEVAPPRPPRVEVLELEPVDHRVSVHTHGSAAPRDEIELLAETAGRLTALALDPGSDFEEGDVLARLDPRDAALALQRAEALLRRRESEVQLARSRLDRQQSLAARRITSDARLEEATHAVDLAEALLQDARAVRGQAARELERTRVRAPFSGRVRERHVATGQFVARGAPLARIYASARVEVRLPVPLSELAFLELTDGEGGTRPRVELRGRDAGTERRWRGRIVRSEGVIDPRTRMLYLVARVDDPEGREPGGWPLRHGLFVEATIEGRTLHDVFVLPAAALSGAGGVFVVGEDGRVSDRDVEVVRREDDRVIVRAGLRRGERVCASAVGSLSGRLVDPILPGSSSSPSSLARSLVEARL